MNDKKIIIRNCPCFNEGHPVLDYYGECLSLTDDAQVCKDCTDCVMKQIYFIAKESLKECKNCGTFIHECDGCDFNKSSVLNNILQLLSIQEVE